MDNIVYYNANQHEREGYATDLNDGNFENDLDAAIAGTGIEGDHINSGCIYSILIINGKILFYDYCLQLPISKLQSLPQIDRHQPLYRIVAVVSLFR